MTLFPVPPAGPLPCRVVSPSLDRRGKATKLTSLINFAVATRGISTGPRKLLVIAVAGFGFTPPAGSNGRIRPTDHVWLRMHLHSSLVSPVDDGFFPSTTLRNYTGFCHIACLYHWHSSSSVAVYRSRLPGAYHHHHQAPSPESHATVATENFFLHYSSSLHKATRRRHGRRRLRCRPQGQISRQGARRAGG